MEKDKKSLGKKLIGFIQKIAIEIPRQISKKLGSIDNDCFAEGKKGTVIRELNTSTKGILDEIIKKANEEFRACLSNSSTIQKFS